MISSSYNDNHDFFIPTTICLLESWNRTHVCKLNINPFHDYTKIRLQTEKFSLGEKVPCPNLAQMPTLGLQSMVLRNGLIAWDMCPSVPLCLPYQCPAKNTKKNYT